MQQTEVKTTYLRAKPTRFFCFSLLQIVYFTLHSGIDSIQGSIVIDLDISTVNVNPSNEQTSHETSTVVTFKIIVILFFCVFSQSVPILNLNVLKRKGTVTVEFFINRGRIHTCFVILCGTFFWSGVDL